MSTLKARFDHLQVFSMAAASVSTTSEGSFKIEVSGPRMMENPGGLPESTGPLVVCTYTSSGCMSHNPHFTFDSKRTSARYLSVGTSTATITITITI